MESCGRAYLRIIKVTRVLSRQARSWLPHLWRCDTTAANTGPKGTCRGTEDGIWRGQITVASAPFL